MQRVHLEFYAIATLVFVVCFNCLTIDRSFDLFFTITIILFKKPHDHSFFSLFQTESFLFIITHFFQRQQQFFQKKNHFVQGYRVVSDCFRFGLNFLNLSIIKIQVVLINFHLIIYFTIKFSTGSKKTNPTKVRYKH